MFACNFKINRLHAVVYHKVISYYYNDESTKVKKKKTAEKWKKQTKKMGGA